MSSNVIWHARRLITQQRFLGMVYPSYALYRLRKNGLENKYITERCNISLQIMREFYSIFLINDHISDNST